MYYSYYKTIAESKDFFTGMEKLSHDNLSEYSNVIDASRKYSLLPEVILLNKTSSYYPNYPNLNKTINFIIYLVDSSRFSLSYCEESRAYISRTMLAGKTCESYQFYEILSC